MAGPPDSRSRAFSLICAAEARHFLALGEPSDFVACRKATLDLAFHDYARLAYGMPQPPPASLSQSIRSITHKVRVFGTTNVAGPKSATAICAFLGSRPTAPLPPAEWGVAPDPILRHPKNDGVLER